MQVKYYITQDNTVSEVSQDYFYQQVDSDVDAEFEITASVGASNEQL